MRKTCQGGCHCGAVRFQCEIDLAPPGQRSEQDRPGPWYGSTFRCNCSYCTKTRYWKAFVAPERFRLVQGEDALGDYLFGGELIHHHFCRTCAVNTFAKADFEVMGGAFVCINIACLDDATDAELGEAPITFEDGRNDAWDQPPKETRYL